MESDAVTRSRSLGLSLALLCLSATPLSAEQFGLFTYQVVDDAVWISRYPATEVGEVVVPAEIDGRPVTGIGGAFEGCSGLTSITIPGSVTNINSAFGGCSGLRSLAIPDGVTGIGQETFRRCSGLTSITLPESVTEIGEDAFFECSGLTSITMPQSVTYIGESAFFGCSRLRSITIPRSVTALRAGAFGGCAALASAVFLGDAPDRVDGVFWGAGPGFTIYHPSCSTGFTSPTAEGHAVVAIDGAPALGSIATIAFTPAGRQLMLPVSLGTICRHVGVEYSPDLSPGSWVELGNFSPAGNFSAAGGTLAFTDRDPVRKARPAGYYRAFLRPAVP